MPGRCLSLLSHRTQVGREAWGLSQLAWFTENAGRSLDALDPATRRALASAGIDAGEWDLIRATPP